MKREFILRILIAGALSIFALIVIPREYYEEDMLIHVPFVKKKLDANLYRNDYIFRYPNPQSQATVYYTLVGSLLSISTLESSATLRFAYAIYLFWLFILMLSFSQMIFSNLAIGILLVLFIMLRIPIGGTAVSTLETELLPRSLGILGSLTAVYLWLKKKPLVAVVVILLTAVIHPLSAFAILSIWIYSIVYRKVTQQSPKKGWITAGLLLSTLALGGALKPSMDLAWLSIIELRNRYAYMHLWHWQAWVLLIGTLLPGIFLLLRHRSDYKHIKTAFIVLVGTSLIITLIHIFFAIFFPTPLVISLQLGRIWWYPVILSLAVLSIFIVQLFSQSKRIILIAAGGVLVILRNTLTQSTETGSYWLDAQRWARDNTETVCAFLVPFASRGFRMESERAISGEYKDGALSFYSQDFARDWNERRVRLSGWEKKTDSELVRLQREYGFHYAVEPSDQSKRSFPMKYENKRFRVYQMSQSCVAKV